jgi:hypothetical protein
MVVATAIFAPGTGNVIGETPLDSGMRNMSETPPVLFIVFNRLDTALEVVEAMAAVRPPKLYIAADGPRPGRPGEAATTAEVRAAVIAAITWPCKVRTLFQEQNLGCRRGVVTAIDWFFANEAEGIILEDDVVPSPDFFRFCSEMLDRYRDEPRIMMVSGTNQLGAGVTSSSYLLSSLGSIWGWASWRRAWARYDEGMTGWNDAMAISLERRHGRATARYLRHIFDFHRRHDVDTWDTQWTYTIQATDGLAVLPEANLIRNIGIVGAHSSIETTNHNLAHGTIRWPMVPRRPAIEDDADYREQLARTVMKPAMTMSRVSRIARKYGVHRPLRLAYEAILVARRRLGG